MTCTLKPTLPGRATLTDARRPNLYLVRSGETETPAPKQWTGLFLRDPNKSIVLHSRRETHNRKTKDEIGKPTVTGRAAAPDDLSADSETSREGIGQLVGDAGVLSLSRVHHNTFKCTHLRPVIPKNCPEPNLPWNRRVNESSG